MLVITAWEYNGVTNGIIFSVTSNLINYFSHRWNAVVVTENVKWRVTTIWLNDAQSVRFWPHISCLERAGVGMMMPLQMRWWLAGWADHALAHAVSLHALTAKHNKTATMATSQGNSKVVSSNWKYRHYFSLILIKGKKVCVTCSYAQEKRLYPHLPQATRILWSSSHQHMLTRQAAICWIQLNTKCSKILWIVFLFFNQLI